MTTAPRISVLLPVYNARPYVEEAVSSVLRQTFADFELIIVDDGSTDGSGNELERLAKRDSRIVLKRRRNLGLVATLNEMIGAARGELLARMDADDVSAPGRFAAQVATLDRDPSLVAVGSNVLSIDPKGRPLMPLSRPRTHQEIVAFTMNVIGGSAMCHPTMMIRRSAMRAVGGYRLEYWPAEDADLVLRLAEIGTLENLQQELLSYRAHPGSIGHSFPFKQRQAMYRAAATASARLGLPLPHPALQRVAEHEWNDGAHEAKWAWWAIGAGNLGSARAIALEALLKRPLSKTSWKVLACALRGH